MDAQQIRILVADDDSNDRWFLGKAFAKFWPEASLEFVRDGQEVIEFLEDGSHPLPSLLVMDLRMTRLTAFEVLIWLRGKAELNKLPVVILSGSEVNDDRGQSLELGAKAFFAKSFDFADYRLLVQRLRQFC